MPIALDPSQKIDYTLKGDVGTPQKFHIRYLPSGRFRKAIEAYDKAFEVQLVTEADDLMSDVIRIGVCGWDGMAKINEDGTVETVPFSTTHLEWMITEVLTPDEKRELARAVCERQRLSDDEKKASASPAQSGAVEYVEVVPGIAAIPRPATCL